MYFDPFKFQETAIAHALLRPRTGYWLSMGTGKTVCALTVARIWLLNMEVSRVLIIGPKRVATHTWPKQIAKWDHTKNLDYGHIVSDGKGGLKFPDPNLSMFIISRDLWSRLVDLLWSEWPFDAVIWDESSGLRRPGTERFKALKKVAPKINKMIQLTGTPAPQSLLNIWCQIWAMDAGRSLGKSFTKYKQNYFKPLGSHQHAKWVPCFGAREEIYSKIAHLCVSMKARDYLELPEVTVVDVPVTLPKATMERYRDFKTSYLLQTPNLETIKAANAGVLVAKLQQLTQGAVYLQESENNLDFEVLHDVKLDALQELYDEMNGEPFLVAYVFKSDLARLRKRFPDGKHVDDPGAMDSFIKGELSMMFMHPAGGGHGLDELQYGSRHVVWLGLSWDLELYEQTNARLDRLGQKQNGFVHRILAEGTVDFKIAQALDTKSTDQNALLEAVKIELVGEPEEPGLDFQQPLGSPGFMESFMAA